MTTKAEADLSKELQDLAKKLEIMLEKRAGKPMLFSLIVFNDEPGSRIHASSCNSYVVRRPERRRDQDMGSTE